MTASATFHLEMGGSTGAGGDLLLMLRLVQEFYAMHFSIDDWMVRLFGADSAGAISIDGGSPSVSAAARA